MALVVGTNVYDTLANANTYWVDRGNTTWGDADAPDKEAALIKATDYLDRNYRWRGSKATTEQRLGWPRIEAFDDDEYAIGVDAAPWQVKEAMFIVADLYLAGETDLEGIVTMNQRSLKRQKVDVIEVEYDAGSRGMAATSLSHVSKLLSQVSSGGETRLLRV